MTRNAHVLSMDIFAGEPVADERLVNLADELIRHGEIEQVADISETGYDRASQNGDRLLAGRFGALACYTIPRCSQDYETAMDYGEKSQEAVPKFQPVGDKQPLVVSTVTRRVGGAFQTVLSTNAAGVRGRALKLLKDDYSEHAAQKEAIARAISGDYGAHLALEHAYAGLADSLDHLPTTIDRRGIIAVGREAMVNTAMLSFVLPQRFGRVAGPLRPLQRQLAKKLLG